MKLSGQGGLIDWTKYRVSRLLVALAFIALVAIASVFIFERLSNVYFHNLMFMGTHVLTIIMVGILTPLAALIVVLQYERLNQKLLTENIERSKAEKGLRDAKAQAELYIDLMSHDINNANQISMGFLEMAVEKVRAEGKLGQENIMLIEKPFESLKNIARLIKNVRKLQMEQSRKLSLKPVDVSQVLNDVKAQYSHIPDRDIAINYTAKTECLVLANELITDLFSNIVGNAIKHSSGPLTVDMRLTMATEDGQNYCNVSIEDNGPGMPDEVKKQISDRLCMANVRYTGKGFGFCLIKILLDDFKGKLQIEDRVRGDYEKGTKITVKIPQYKIAGP